MYLGRSSFHKRDVLSDTDVLSPLNDTSYGGSARMTASMRKTLSNSIASGDGRNSNTMGNTYVPEDEPRAKVYRPPDYPSALFSRDSAYDDGGLEGSGTNGSFDAPLSSILPLHGAIDSSTLVDYYDAFLLNSPENHRSYPQVSIDTSATSTSASEMFPSHPSMTTDTSTLG